jgi:hypothetical protein
MAQSPFVISGCWKNIARVRRGRRDMHLLAGLPQNDLAFARLADF